MHDDPGAPRPLRSIATPVVVVACVLALVAVAWHLWYLPLTEPGYGLFTNGVDTKVYRGGALAVLHDTPLYSEPVYKVWQFTYPPFAALVLSPLGLLGPYEAFRLMNAVNVLCLLLLIFLTLRALRFRRDGRFWLTLVALTVAATLLEPVRTTIWNGQINLVLAVLVVGCLTLPLGRWRGIGVGLAAGIKLTPLFFAGYLLVTKQWRALVTALVVFALTVALGFVVLRGQAAEFWTGIGQDTSRIGPLDAVANQSFNGFFARMSTVGVWHAPTWLWLPVGVVLAVLGLYVAWRAYRAGAEMLAITLTGLTSCAVSPFSWGHHWIWLVPLLILALVQATDAARSDRPWTWLWWLAPTAVAAIGYTWRVRVLEDGVERWRFGSYRLFWSPGGSGWDTAVAVIGAGAYLWVFLATLVVTLWWTARVDPIRFKPNDVAAPVASS
ncbi:glycosyltransferase 87 family protein [Gordonia alkaliphila]|uniref:glycosyltransferase 87 family protein n=1 Tax=Gordonia alkaliphila TaxID=1053547 RepID=UPI001FF3118E|nr:glycosyltransferase 87 family protein [Gordonia alkaliphila]MCK0440516.1 glycosyltransferase 87 family protein [Gordonia alkaliphila]